MSTKLDNRGRPENGALPHGASLIHIKSLLAKPG
jgi:hypothetical protein